MYSATTVNGGSMNIVTLPLRANSSQAISNIRIEKIAGAAAEDDVEPPRCSARKVGFRSRQRGLIFYSRHRSNHCMSA